MRKNHRRSVILSVLLITGMLLGMAMPVKGQDEEETEINNGIPVIYLNIDESQGTIEAMHESPDHSVFCYGTFSVVVPKDFHYSDFPDISLSSMTDLEMSIRGRGNSTWRMADKKPYKIKLKNNPNVLGLGANNHWVLIANDFDPTLLRDRITAWLGDKMGFSFTPRGVPVDVIMTGSEFGTHYLGSYYLSENVRVDDNRLEIAKLKKDDTDPAIITGGYLLQNAMQIRDGSPDRFFTSRGVDWATNTPSFDVEQEALSSEPEDGEEAFIGRELNDGYENPVQQQYIQNYMQMAEDVLFDGTTAYRDLFDVENSAKYWLVNEISMNNDAYATGSTYIYKDRDPENGTSKLLWGPLWDFDFAWTRNFTWIGFAAGHKWVKPMFCDREEGGFLEAVKDNWPEMKGLLEELIKDNGVIDQYCAETEASAIADYKHFHDERTFDYKAEVETLKNWIRNRIDWVDENLDLLDDLVHKVTFMADGEVYAYDFLEQTDTITGREAYPEKEGYTFLGWMDEEGNIIEEEQKVTKDRVLTAKYVSDDSMTHATDIAFRKASDIIQSSMMMKYYEIPYVIVPEDAEDQRVKWTSSDSNLASVDEKGRVNYYGTGTVVFTAELKHGRTRTFTLTIVETSVDPLPYPESIFPEEETIRMSVDEQSVFMIGTDPNPAKISKYEYESEDPSVVTVSDFGVLTAVGPGEARVRVRATARDENYEEFVLETYTTVIVSKVEPEPEPTPEPTPEPAPVPKPAYELPVTGID